MRGTLIRTFTIKMRITGFGKLIMKRTFKFCPLCKGELVPGIVENGKKLVCRKCGWIDYRNPLSVAVCAVINTEGKILSWLGKEIGSLGRINGLYPEDLLNRMRVQSQPA